jgi:hypothetical protein
MFYSRVQISAMEWVLKLRTGPDGLRGDDAEINGLEWVGRHGQGTPLRRKPQHTTLRIHGTSNRARNSPNENETRLTVLGTRFLSTKMASQDLVDPTVVTST